MLEDIKAKLSGAKCFSKLDFKSLSNKLHPDSRYAIVFKGNDKLYKYKGLTMGLKPSQVELNKFIKQIFAHIMHS